MLRLRHANQTTAVAKFADVVLHGAGPDPIVAISPVVWTIKDGHDQREWYFSAASVDRQGRFHVDALIVGTLGQDFANDCLAAVIVELTARRPVVIHAFDDEFELARFCVALWPCARTRQIHQSVEHERATT